MFNEYADAKPAEAGNVEATYEPPALEFAGNFKEDTGQYLLFFSDPLWGNMW